MNNNYELPTDKARELAAFGARTQTSPNSDIYKKQLEAILGALTPEQLETLRKTSELPIPSSQQPLHAAEAVRPDGRTTTTQTVEGSVPTENATIFTGELDSGSLPKISDKSGVPLEPTVGKAVPIVPGTGVAEALLRNDMLKQALSSVANNITSIIQRAGPAELDGIDNVPIPKVNTSGGSLNVVEITFDYVYAGLDHIVPTSGKVDLAEAVSELVSLDRVYFNDPVVEDAKIISTTDLGAHVPAKITAQLEVMYTAVAWIEQMLKKNVAGKKNVVYNTYNVPLINTLRSRRSLAAQVNPHPIDMIAVMSGGPSIRFADEVTAFIAGGANEFQLGIVPGSDTAISSRVVTYVTQELIDPIKAMCVNRGHDIHDNNVSDPEIHARLAALVQPIDTEVYPQAPVEQNKFVQYPEYYEKIRRLTALFDSLSFERQDESIGMYKNTCSSMPLAFDSSKTSEFIGSGSAIVAASVANALSSGTYSDLLNLAIMTIHPNHYKEEGFKIKTETGAEAVLSLFHLCLHFILFPGPSNTVFARVMYFELMRLYSVIVPTEAGNYFTNVGYSRRNIRPTLAINIEQYANDPANVQFQQPPQQYPVLNRIYDIINMTSALPADGRREATGYPSIGGNSIPCIGYYPYSDTTADREVSTKIFQLCSVITDTLIVKKTTSPSDMSTQDRVAINAYVSRYNTHASEFGRMFHCLWPNLVSFAFNACISPITAGEYKNPDGRYFIPPKVFLNDDKNVHRYIRQRDVTYSRNYAASTFAKLVVKKEHVDYTSQVMSPIPIDPTATISHALERMHSDLRAGKTLAYVYDIINTASEGLDIIPVVNGLQNWSYWLKDVSFDDNTPNLEDILIAPEEGGFISSPAGALNRTHVFGGINNSSGIKQAYENMHKILKADVSFLFELEPGIYTYSLVNQPSIMILSAANRVVGHLDDISLIPKTYADTYMVAKACLMRPTSPYVRAMTDGCIAPVYTTRKDTTAYGGIVPNMINYVINGQTTDPATGNNVPTGTVVRYRQILTGTEINKVEEMYPNRYDGYIMRRTGNAVNAQITMEADTNMVADFYVLSKADVADHNDPTKWIRFDNNTFSDYYIVDIFAYKDFSSNRNLWKRKLGDFEIATVGAIPRLALFFCDSMYTTVQGSGPIVMESFDEAVDWLEPGKAIPINDYSDKPQSSLAQDTYSEAQMLHLSSSRTVKHVIQSGMNRDSVMMNGVEANLVRRSRVTPNLALFTTSDVPAHWTSNMQQRALLANTRKLVNPIRVTDKTMIMAHANEHNLVVALPETGI